MNINTNITNKMLENKMKICIKNGKTKWSFALKYGTFYDNTCYCIKAF